ncbi:hypothetical protein [Pseudacidovorax intermedius]|uniref:hypothetical protein n=1 Tax=Pseudacidovorax intermedius TaxID=433924 RepID=UPI0026EF7072|nr:hypothetical protein [Pseudacidovorax intermedius]
MATATPNNTKAAKAVKVKVLRVVARAPSFRRCGFAFGAEARRIPLDDLSKEQVEALKSEPLLVATEEEIEVPAADAADKPDT